MNGLTRRIGFLVGVLFFGVGLGVLMSPISSRNVTPRQWALAAGIDLPTWFAIGGILFVGGIGLLILARRPPRT